MSIQSDKEACISSRKNCHRELRRHPYSQRIIDTRRRKITKKTIKQRKHDLWRELCEKLNDDIGGQGYKIVDKKWMTREREQETINLLSRNWTTCQKTCLSRDDSLEFTREELEHANYRLKSGKALGPEGIPLEAVKQLVKFVPSSVLKVLINLLWEQTFLREWKVAKLVIIPKQRKSLETASSDRPLCLINAISKLYEDIVKTRPEQEVNYRSPMAASQYEFTKGKFTIHAVQEVVKFSERIRFGGIWERGCALVTVDIRNAFNTALWSLILWELQIDYFVHRKIHVEEVAKELTTAADIPQGSAIGRLLWVFYDNVLRINHGEGTKTIGYADDLSLSFGRRPGNYRQKKRASSVKNWGYHTERQTSQGRYTFWTERRGVEVVPLKCSKYLGI